MNSQQQHKLEFLARHRAARRQDLRLACASDTSEDALRKQLDSGMKAMLKTFGSGKCKGYQIADPKVAAKLGALPSATRVPGAEQTLPTTFAIAEYMARLIHTKKVKHGLMLREEFETHFPGLIKDGVAFEPCYALALREEGLCRLERYDVDLGSAQPEERVLNALSRLRNKSETLSEMMDSGAFTYVLITTAKRRELLKDSRLKRIQFDGYPARVELVASDILQNLGR